MGIDYISQVRVLCGKYKHILITFLLVIFCLGISAYLYKVAVVPASMRQAVLDSNTGTINDTVGEITSTSEITQTFIATSQNITGLRFQTGTYNRTNSGTLTFKLVDMEKNEVVYNKQFPLKSCKDNLFFEILFEEPLQNAQGKEYKMIITSPDSQKGNAITLWSSFDEGYEQGSLTVNGLEKPGDISFQILSGTNMFLKPIYFAAVVVITLFIAAIYFLIAVKKCKIEKVFLICGIFFGLIYTALMTPGSIPDELSHHDEAYRYSNVMMGYGYSVEGAKEAETDLPMMKRADDISLPRLQVTPSVGNYKYISKHLFDKPENLNTEVYSGLQVNTAPQMYVISGLGITVARLLHLNALWLYYFGRLFNLIFYVIAVYFAIKLIPFGKMVLFSIALMPMPMHLAVSYSYDAIVNGLAFWAIGYCLYLAYGDVNITIKHIAILCLTFILFAPSKGGAYILLCALCLLIPKAKFRNVKRYLLSIGAVIACALITFIIYNLSSTTAMASGGENIVAWTGTPGYTLSYILAHPVTALKIFAQTYNVQIDFFINSMIATPLGWLKVDIPETIATVFLIFILLAATKVEGEHQILKWKSKVWMALIAIGIIGLISLAMFTSWTPTSSLVILGIQGRYFLPIFPIAVLLTRNSALTLKKNIDKPLMVGVNLLQVVAISNVFMEVLINLN